MSSKLFSSPSSTMANIRRSAEMAIEGFGEVYQTIIWKTILANIILLAITLLATFLYGSLYYTYIPQSMQRRQLYFQRTQIIKERMDAQGDLMKISASALSVEIPLYDTDTSAGLSPGQSYNIHIQLDMPESEVNHNAGTFMVSALYYEKTRKLLTSSSRLVMLKYRSWLLRIMDTIFYSPLYLLGWSEQSQNRNIELFKNYKENAYRPTALIAIDIDSPNLQIYEATLIFEAQFTGLMYFMYYWPTTTAVIGIGMIWFLLGVMFSSSWLALTSSSNEADTSPTASNTLKLEPASDTVSETMNASTEQKVAERELTLPSCLDSARRADNGADDNPTAPVSSLGVTDIDASGDISTKLNPSNIRRRNLTAEQPRT